MPGDEVVRRFLRTIRKVVFNVPSCKEASILLSRAQDEPLGRWDRFRLRLHLRVCSACRNFVAQLDFLRSAMKRYTERD